MALAVPRGNWLLHENKCDVERTEYKLIRIFEFAHPQMPGAACTLQLGCIASADLSGSIHASIEFELQPYLYLRLGNMMPLGSGMKPAPFSVGLVTVGGGTQESLLVEGGMCKVSWYSIEDEPELVFLRVGPMEDEVQCLRRMASGKEMTFTILSETEPYRRLELRLPNDGEFRRLYSDIYDTLKRESDKRFGRPQQYAAESSGLMGFVKRLFS